MMNIIMVSERRLGDPYLKKLADMDNIKMTLPKIISKISPDFF